MQWDLQAERELWADICTKDFYWFIREAWGLDHNPKIRFFTPRVHKPICEWLQHFGLAWLAARQNPVPERTYLALEIPREYGKTTLIGAFLLWLHLHDVDLSAYIGSETLTQSEMWFLPTHQTMKGSNYYARFHWLYGVWESRDRRFSKSEVIHAARRDLAIKEPSFGIWGVATGITGVHPDILDLDDPISYERLETDSGWFDTVNHHVDSLIPILKANGLMIWPGTRYGAGDHFGKGFAALGIKSVAGHALPDEDAAHVRPDGMFHVYFLQGRTRDGKPHFPEQWPESRLAEFQKKNPLRYAAQIMNAPSSSEFNPFTLEQARNIWIEKKDVPFPALRYTIHCDTAFKYQARQARGDESVIVVFGHLPTSGDVYYVEGYGSNTWRNEDFGNKLVSIVQRYRAMRRRVALITDELEFGGKAGSWEALLRNYFHHVNLPMPPLIFLNRAGKNKTARITEAAGYWADGHVKVIRDAPGAERLIKQMTEIGTGGFDDWSDAAADVFNKEVYVPMRRLGADSGDSPIPHYPGDEYLKTGILSDREASRIADAWEAKQQDMADAYDPI